MAVSPCYKSLYRRAGWLVIFLTLLLAQGQISPAQYAKRRSMSQGPRALGLLELAKNGKAHLIPITILFEGKFYDAGAYKASPVPMALEPETVYEAVASGVSQGIFTITDARQLKDTWIADGTWLPAGSGPAKPAHRSDEKPIMGDTDEPPVLRRPSTEKPSTQNLPPGSKTQAPQQPTPTPPPASASRSTNTSPTSPEPSPLDDKEHPVLRRGKPNGTNKPEDETPTGTTPKRGTMAGKQAPSKSSSTPAVQLFPAISDADGPDLRPYTCNLKPEEEQNYRKKMLALAVEEIRARARQIGAASAEPSSATVKQRRPAASATWVPPALDNIRLRCFDLSSSNEPILVMTASARMARVSSVSATNGDLQYFVALVAHADIYGELRKLYSRVTDTRHLDAIPRMELIDAVDVDGDGRGELLFRQTSEAGSAFNVYRVTGDRLWPLFEGAPQ